MTRVVPGAPESGHLPGTPAACLHWISIGPPWPAYCSTRDGVRLYGVGLRCARHTPARLAGRTEPRTTAVNLPDSSKERAS